VLLGEQTLSSLDDILLKCQTTLQSLICGIPAIILLDLQVEPKSAEENRMPNMLKQIKDTSR
jgi:hypothetical protein